MPRMKAFGNVSAPHRKVALAQCRIGFQPVSPGHRANRREADLFRSIILGKFIDEKRWDKLEGIAGSGKETGCFVGMR
jgi:hypothetical protein